MISNSFPKMSSESDCDYVPSDSQESLDSLGSSESDTDWISQSESESELRVKRRLRKQPSRSPKKPCLEDDRSRKAKEHCLSYIDSLTPVQRENPGPLGAVQTLKNILDSIGRNDPADELDEEPWFQKLSKQEKEVYRNKIRFVAKYKRDLPSMKDILDLDLDRMNTKKLLTMLYYLETMDQLTPDYELMCQELFVCLENAKKNLDKQKQLEEIEERLNKLTSKEDDLKTRILLSPLPDPLKALVYQKWCMMEEDGDNAGKYRQWIEVALNIPRTPKPVKMSEDGLGQLVEQVTKSLNKKVYGMEQAKDELVCLLTNLIVNEKCKNKAFGLVGPPGVGKTKILEVAAQELGLPYKRISVGGTTDAAFIEGHGFTYIGAEPGIIVKAVLEMGSTLGIICIDEIDKLSQTEHGKEVENSLLHVTDFTQNHDFRDKFIPEIPVDLSNFIFVYLLNDTENMSSAMISRMPLISIEGYTKAEKQVIVRNYLAPELYTNYGIPTGDIILPEETVRYLIEMVPEQDERNGKSGVRNLKNSLDRILKRINLYRLVGREGRIIDGLSFKIPDFKLPYRVTKSLVDQTLKERKPDVPEGLYT